MEGLVRKVGYELSSTESRRRFLGRFGRGVLQVGAGLALWAGAESVADRQAFAQFTNCCPECCPPLSNCQPGNPGVTCADCNTVSSGCPNGLNNYYSWWCCGQVGLRECADCKDASGNCCGCTHNPGGPC